MDTSAAGRDLVAQIQTQVGQGPIDLACLFFSSHHAPQAELLVEKIGAALSPRILVGCSGEGVIAGQEEIELAPAVALWSARLPGVSLTPVRPTLLRTDESMEISEWTAPPQTETHGPCYLMFADPYSTQMNVILSYLSDAAPGGSVIGGLAGGGQDLGDNRLILNGQVYHDGLVGVALSGPIVVRSVVSQGCRPIGERYLVTRGEGNVIHELGGQPALQQLQELFASLTPDERRLAEEAIHVGIVIDEHRDRFERGDFLVRNLIGADRGSGSLFVGEHVREGQTIQFQVRDGRSASEDLHLLLAAARSRQSTAVRGALLFSCCARGRGLFGRAHHDITVARERLGDIPISGFFAQGEIGPVGGENYVHGYTASMALFCDPS